MAAVTVQSAAEALDAVRAGHSHLTSAENAGAVLGALWFQAMERELRQAFPDKKIVLDVHCGDAAGRVLECLRAGLKSVVFTGDPATLASLRSAAESCGSVVRGP